MSIHTFCFIVLAKQETGKHEGTLQTLVLRTTDFRDVSYSKHQIFVPRSYAFLMFLLMQVSNFCWRNSFWTFWSSSNQYLQKTEAWFLMPWDIWRDVFFTETQHLGSVWKIFFSAEDSTVGLKFFWEDLTNSLKNLNISNSGGASAKILSPHNCGAKKARFFKEQTPQTVGGFFECTVDKPEIPAFSHINFFSLPTSLCP